MKARILSIDGGGIKGIVPAKILDYIEKEIRKKKADYHIHESFKLLSGTSTGGIIVVGLLTPGANNKPKYSVSDLLSLYVDKGHEIFSTSWIRRAEAMGRDEYDSTNIERLFKEYFDNIKLSQLLRDCLIASYDIYDRAACFFNTLDTKTGDYNDYLVRDITRATSAAPTYFPPAHIQSLGAATMYPMIDGGVFANNPAMCALVELTKSIADEGTEFPLDFKDIMMLSIGTGKQTAKEKRYTYDKTKNWGKLQWVSPLIDIMMSANSETIDYQLKQLYKYTGNAKNYIRLQPELTRSAEAMDDTSPANIQALLEDADKYITDNEDTLNMIIEMLM